MHLPPESPSSDVFAALDPTPDELRALFRALILPRAIEEKKLRLIRQNRIQKWFSGYGQEAISVGTVWALEEQDYLLPMHRNLGVWTSRGVPLRRLMCQLMGKEGGFTKGRDRTFHFGLPERRIIGMISHLAAMLPVACGLGLAAQLSGESFVAAAFIGDGATREGDFHEALNLAAVWKLPVLFLVENNGYGLSTPVADAIPVDDLALAATGYNIPGHTVDGNDVLAVAGAVRAAAQRARAGEGPTLLEFKTFRMRGHEEASGTAYVPDELFDLWKERDPVQRLTRQVLEANAMSEEDMEALWEALRQDVDDAAAFGLDQPLPSSTPEAEHADVYAAAPVVVEDDEPMDGPVEERRFIDAITDGLDACMASDERVLLMGQDIAGYGGVFKVTEGFVERYGPDRVRNTPIIESGALGAAMGLALEGYRPVVEIQYADFISCGFNQIVNNLATTHYRWGAPLNVTIRAPFGGHIGAGPFHSQSVEAWFCHVPGLKVVIPSTPADAKGLLRTALDDPNPVLFLEHKALYRSLRGEVPVGDYRIPFGQARVVREGEDLTLVTYGIGVRWALEEAQHQAAQGYSLEVVDLRTLAPLDMGTLLASVRKTNRVLVLHEATRTGGFGAELTARLAEEAFQHLDAPPVRVAGADLPIPFAGPLEKEIHSATSRLRPALEQLLSF